MNDLQRLEEMASSIERSPWVGQVLRGGMPKIPSVAALPTAREEYAYRLVVLRGTPDIAYVCLRDAGGTWGWEVVATG